MTQEQINKVVAAVTEDRKKVISDAAHSRRLDIGSSTYSQVFRSGHHDKMTDAQWSEIAYRLKVNLKSSFVWNVARTPTFEFIYAQLAKCQKESMSLIFCDAAGLGKTFTAERYEEDNDNVALVDCSINKTKKRLLNQISREMGIPSTGTPTVIFDRLIYHINNVKTKPLVILDEAGDLDRHAFLEIKALWNATRDSCGWYMMGAVGLKKRIELGTNNEFVGYEEIFDRYGAKFQSITNKEEWGNDIDKFKTLQIAMVAQANPEGDLLSVIAGADKSLRNVSKEVKKLRGEE